MKDFKILYIDPVEAEAWIMKKHYAKRKPSISFCFGLYKNNILEGVLTIGKPASYTLCEGICGKENSQYVYELNRLCVNDGLPKNSLSFFVSGCLRRLNNTENMILVSYADSAMGHHGYIYQATNFIYTGKTQERTDPKSETGHHRHTATDGTVLERQTRSSKFRYIIFLGKKKKQFLKNLKYDILPYPKGENKRYDASYSPETQVLLF